MVRKQIPLGRLRRGSLHTASHHSYVAQMIQLVTHCTLVTSSKHQLVSASLRLSRS